MWSKSLAEKYLSDINGQTKLRATWPPGAPLTLGTVGELDEDGVFTPRGHISSFGITINIETSPSNPLLYQSQSGVQSTTKLKGQTSELFEYVGKAQAGARFQFENQAAFVVSIHDVTLQRISDQIALKYQLRQLIN